MKEMSPFTQITDALNPHVGIDRQFSPILNYIDEFDRHFSHRHRFLNCFIPRFDLEEDPQTYFLYGELPGADVDEITIEAGHDDHTLTVFGTTHRPGQAPEHSDGTPNSQHAAYINVDASNAGHPRPSTSKASEASDNGSFIKVDVSDAGKPTHKEYVPPTTPYTEPVSAPRPANLINVDASNAGHPRPQTPSSTKYINVDVSDAGKPAPSQRQEYGDRAKEEAEEEPSYHEREREHEHADVRHQQQEEHHHNNNKRRVLLSERIVGDFHRTFTFPAPVEVDLVQARLENGVLRLLVPKKEGVRERRRIAIRQ